VCEPRPTLTQLSTSPFANDVLWIFDGNTGNDITTLSLTPAQQEILFSPRCYFTMTKKGQRPDGVWAIHLKSKNHEHKI